MKKLVSSLMILLMILSTFPLFTQRGSAIVVSRTYTLDADYDEGTLVGVEHETVHDQLQLSKEYTTLPFIWVPNNEGTVSKIDTATGRELGRYWVSNGTDSSPSRTTVDLLGNCWVGCRQRGTVVKIGLFEAGQWIDRNLDGICQTSQDTNADGDITGAEILPWGQDECVLYEVVLVPGYEGTYVPGTYSGSYDFNYWGVSPRGLAIDANNNLWAGTWSTSKYFYIDGSTGAIIRSVDVSPHNAYGAAMDENGILWSAEGPGGDAGHLLLRFDPSTDAQSYVNIGHTCYGLGLDYNHHLWVSSYWNFMFSRVDISVYPPTFTTYNAPEQISSRGVAATSDNNIWVANTDAHTVTRYDNNGNLVATITGLNGPTGVSVDANGEVWATNVYDEYVHRIDPNTNTIDLSKQIIGSGGHYTYSDMTGIVSRTITTKIGTWTVIFDSGVLDMPWGTVSWNSFEPAGTTTTVRVCSSNDNLAWSPWESASNGIPLSATPNGRYLKIEAKLQIFSGDVSPELYDLTVQTLELGIPADVDIKPDVLNLRARCRWIKAYIELPEGYDVNDIDVSTVLLNGTVPADLTEPPVVGDYDSDTIPDMMVRFNRTEVAEYILSEGIVFGDVVLTLTGNLYDDTQFEGNDIVRVSALIGDVNCDGTNNINDIVLASGSYGAKEGDPNWNCNANFAASYDIIDILDIVTGVAHYGESIIP